jgi:hypothetical protein
VCNEDGMKLSIKTRLTFFEKLKLIGTKGFRNEKKWSQDQMEGSIKNEKVKKELQPFECLQTCRHGCRHGSERVLKPKTNKSLT